MKFPMLSLLLLCVALRASCALAAQPEEISLASALDEAARSNPALRAAAAKIDRLEAAVFGQRAQPDPELRVTARTGDPRDEDFSLDQRLLVFGQIPPRVEKAARELEEMTFDYREELLALELDVRKAYLQALRDSELLAIAGENLRIAESLEAAAQARYRVGEIPQVQLQKVHLESVRAQQDVVEAHRALASSRAALSVLLGRRPGAELKLEKIAVEPAEPPDRDALTKAALARRPLLRSAQSRIRAEEAGTRVAQSLGLPEARLSAYQSDFSAEPKTRGVGLSLIFPLADLGSVRGKVREAKASVREAQHRARALENQVLLEVQDGLLRLGEARTRAASFRSSLLVESEDILNKVLIGYRAGALSYMEVLEAQRTCTAVRRDYQGALFEYAVALWSVERALGAKLESLDERKQ